MTVERYLMEAQKGPAVYVEDVFSTYLYTGTGSAQTITNNIDLSTKGGLVWIKDRIAGTTPPNAIDYHWLYDSSRSNFGQVIWTNTTDAGAAISNLSSTTSGFSLTSYAGCNQSGVTFSSWTFRKQPKFFDCVSYTGNGASSRWINHSLGATPGMVIIKRTDSTSDWPVYARLANGGIAGLYLNSTGASLGDVTPGSASFYWTSTQFDPAQYWGSIANTNGATYIAYLFAHQAGGFGLSGTDSVVACGSATTDGSGNATVSLGWEPQYVLLKRADAASQWAVFDTMRGWASVGTAYLQPNNNNAEGNYGATPVGTPTATGFTMQNFNANATWIYMAIRRGPMKVPTSGTSVFAPCAVNVSAGTKVTTNFPVDWQINYYRGFSANYNGINFARLLGVSSNNTDSGRALWTTKTDAEAGFNGTLGWDNTGFKQTGNLWPNVDNIYWNFARAPGFFDEVCWSGDGSNPYVFNHNLQVAPELVIFKRRDSSASWVVGTNITNIDYTRLFLNLTNAGSTQSYGVALFGAQPTATQLSVVVPYSSAGQSYVGYLFATCLGVSKVGSYTGTGAAQNIDCGFAAGARFILIKRTDSTGDWYTYDSARGISSGDDPYLLLNSTAAEVTGTDYIGTYASGFALTATAPAALNANGGSFIFLAIS